MIRRIRLRQWRSYDALDVEIPDGTTFVVAPNGVGKTSLVLGLAWAVFGDRSGVDARSCIRAGADSAEVEVELLLPDGRELNITKEIGQRGRPKVVGRIDNTELDEDAIIGLLETSFTVDLQIAARLSMMLGGGHLASREAFDLKSHLHRAFGVTDLLETAEISRNVAKGAAKQRGEIRATTQERLADRDSVESRVSELKTLIERHHETGKQLQDKVLKTDRMRRLAERLSTYGQQRQLYEQELNKLLDQAQALISNGIDQAPSVAPADVFMHLGKARQEAERDAKESEAAYASARGGVAAATEALELLTGDSARCPTCLRSIKPDELTTARSDHEHRARTEAEAAEQYAHAQEVHRNQAAAMTALQIRLESLRSPAQPDATHDVPALVDAEASHASALEELNRHSQELGALQSQLQQLQGQIASDDQLTEVERELHLAYRREALATAAAEAFEVAISRVAETVIEPIAAEVRWRWKQLFPNGGLTLRPDGSIVRVHAGQELNWDTLSGGEQIWARIVTHLLVLTSSTKLPFVWFDEPLEHLDPRLRHAVAAALATATQVGNPTQLLVTTYENTIARQLAEDIPDASIINVRAANHRPKPRPTRNEDVDGRDQDTGGRTQERRAS